MRFVDTGILLYAISSDPSEIIAAERAAELLSARDLVCSVAVFEEFLQRAVSGPGALPPDTALAFLDTLRRFPVQESSLDLLNTTVIAARRWQLPLRDAAVIETARLQGCTTVLSTVISTGADLGAIQVVNPLT